jgi:hypothetical protein
MVDCRRGRKRKLVAPGLRKRSADAGVFIEKRKGHAGRSTLGDMSQRDAMPRVTRHGTSGERIRKHPAAGAVPEAQLDAFEKQANSTLIDAANAPTTVMRSSGSPPIGSLKAIWFTCCLRGTRTRMVRCWS